MGYLHAVYGLSLATLTDLYQLTMANGYVHAGIHEREAVFHLYFRKNPFKGGFAVACGVEVALEYLSTLAYTSTDLDFLAQIPGADGRPIFGPKFLDWLGALRLSLDVDCVAEGTPVFPNEPMLRIQGPLAQCQLVETALLTLVNFQTLVATKAARVCLAARGEPVLEFGLRRAQGVDGALSASRAAFVGGVAATSNVLAGRLFGIPVKGTHAHAWVMAFPDELAAFRAYADAMPNNCVFLVDTYDTLEGVRHAIEAGKVLTEAGHVLQGIRLDSGDLAYLSIEARRLLDDAGFRDARIYASNDLDEHLIETLKEQGAQVRVWGVGTQLVTGGDQSALGGVYKLGAIRDEAGAWVPTLKLSEQIAKVSTPGILQVRRFSHEGALAGDMVYDTSQGIDDPRWIVDPNDPTRRKRIPDEATSVDLLEPAMRGGQLLEPRPTLLDARQRCREGLAELHPGILRFTNAHAYPVGLEKGLQRRREDLVLRLRGHA